MKQELRHLPNLISLGRLSSVPVLGWLAHHHQVEYFPWLLLVAALSDVLDGWLARRFGWTSRLGAFLDSLADISLVVVTLYAIWVLHPHVYLVHGMVVWAVVSVWLVVHVAALVRYQRLASFHTRLTRIGILLFVVFVMLLFFYGFSGWLYYPAGLICLFGGVESLVMIALLPQWRPDIPGGLVTVLRERR